MSLIRRLEFLDTTIAWHTSQALPALAAQRFMDHYFYANEDEAEKKRIFKTNIANTFPYWANHALIERSVVPR